MNTTDTIVTVTHTQRKREGEKERKRERERECASDKTQLSSAELNSDAMLVRAASLHCLQQLLSQQQGEKYLRNVSVSCPCVRALIAANTLKPLPCYVYYLSSKCT